MTDNTLSGSDNDVTRKHPSTEVEADKIKGVQAEHMNNSSQSTPYAQGSAQVELDELLNRLMQYSYDYGSGNIPTSENPPLIIARQTKRAILDWHTRKLNEAIREEWALISEVAHSANITAELFISKARKDRLAELDTINAGQTDKNIRLTQERKGER